MSRLPKLPCRSMRYWRLARETSASPIEAQVEVIEPMGSEIYLYLTTGSTSFVARVDAQVKTEVAERKRLLLDMSKCHFFDAQTQETIL